MSKNSGMFLRHLGINQKRMIVLIILLVPIFVLSAKIIAPSINLHHSDFFTFWLAGKMNWLHQSSYNPSQWLSGHNQFGATWIPNDIFPYPLPLALLLSPFGLFTIDQAYILWVVISEILIVISISLFLRTFLGGPKNKHLFFPVIAASFLFRPSIVTIHNGQLSAFLLFILSLTIILWYEQKYWQGAIALSFLALKPTIGLPVIFLVVLWLIFRKYFRKIIVLFASGLVWILIGLIQDGQWIDKFLSNGGKKLIGNLSYFPTLWGISNRLCNEQTLCSFSIGIFSTLILLGMIIWVLFSKKNLSFFNIISLIIPVSLVVTPYIWPYDHILLLIPILYLTIQLFQRGFPYILVALFPIIMSILSLGLLLLATHLKQDTWSVLLPLVIFGLTLALPEK